MNGARAVVSRRASVAVPLLALALLLPLLLEATRSPRYFQHVAVQMMLLGLYAMAWDLLNGYAGMFSFGHAAFFGAGAYGAAIAVVHGGVGSAPLALGAGLVAAVGVGLVVGFLASRVGSVAVFLVTFAGGETLYLTALADPHGLTNGDNGLPGVAPPPLLGLDLGRQLTFYYVALVVVACSYLALRAITRSPFGLVLQGIRDNEVRVRFAGYRVEQYKAAAFAISAFFAGLAGALTAFHERIASPETLAWPISGDAVLYAALGGTGTLVGPLLGAVAVILVRELLSNVFQSWLLLVGFAYVALVFFLPDGLYPLLFRTTKR